MNTELIFNLDYNILPPIPSCIARKGIKTFTEKTILVRNLDGN
jgi:hypothetical protein